MCRAAWLRLIVPGNRRQLFAKLGPRSWTVTTKLNGIPTSLRCRIDNVGEYVANCVPVAGGRGPDVPDLPPALRLAHGHPLLPHLLPGQCNTGC